jgi:hypothetical protein
VLRDEPDALQQRLESRLLAQRIVDRMDLQACDGQFVLIATPFQPPERLIDFAETQVNDGESRAGDVAVLTQETQLMQQMAGIALAASETAGLTERSEQARHIAAQPSGFFEHGNRFFVLALLRINPAH